MRKLAMALMMLGLATAACSSNTTRASDTSESPDITGSAARSSETSPVTVAPESTTSDVSGSDTKPASPTTAPPTTAPPSAVSSDVDGSASPSPIAATTFPLRPAGSADRPFTVEVPKTYNSATPAPLLVVLHGYTSTGASIKGYFNLQPVAEERGFLAVYPDGTKDFRGQPFWNATDACCNFGSSTVDDSGYLMSIIDYAKKTYSVDPKRIYVLGHSNGGFMSYRMACEHADIIAAVVSLAGATFGDAARCKPSEPVSVLQVHGTSDVVISYSGGDILGHSFPAAIATVTTWAGYDRCAPKPIVSADLHSLDLDKGIPGPDTGATTFDGCKAGIGVELLSIDGGAHSPGLSAEFAATVVDFLYKHPKP